MADRGDDRERLDRILVRHLADLAVSRVEAARWVRAGKVEVNGEPGERPARRLFRGDRVAVELPPPPPDAPPLRAEEMPLAILHEDGRRSEATADGFVSFVGWLPGALP